MTRPSSTAEATAPAGPAAPIAAIDIGTNSVHMVVARPLDGGAHEVLAREKEPVRLGRGSSDMKQLESAAIDRTVDVLDRFRQIAEAYGAEIVAVATSAVREAENRNDFLQAARARAGLDVSVISGVEEARLIHLGALGAVQAADRPHLVVDIGGGSTELVAGSSTTPSIARSLKLGHIRLTERYFPDGRVTADAVAECRRYVRAFVAPVAHEIHALGFEIAIGCSGTIENLARVAAVDDGAAPRTVANLAITRSGLARVVEALLAADDASARRQIAGLDAHRADVIVGGAILLRQLFESLGIDEMIVSPAALREGVVLDRFHRRRATADALHHLTDIRRASVIEVARRYDEDLGHAQHATDLALELFDALGSAHELGEPERAVLEAAGMLHNIGRFVAHAAHHKHSYYLIRNSEHLAGFAEHEIELIAHVARYHRKSNPRNKHADFAALDSDAQQCVRVLAGCLRVAIALDRTYRRAVERVTARVDDGVATITLVTAEAADVELELFTARERAGLLGLALGVRIDFVTDPRGST